MFGASDDMTSYNNEVINSKQIWLLLASRAVCIPKHLKESLGCLENQWAEGLAAPSCGPEFKPQHLLEKPGTIRCTYSLSTSKKDQELRGSLGFVRH